MPRTYKDQIIIVLFLDMRVAILSHFLHRHETMSVISVSAALSSGDVWMDVDVLKSLMWKC